MSTTSLTQPPQKTPLLEDYRFHTKVSVLDAQTNVEVYTPQFTAKCCDFILSTGIVEGIFRMNGSIRNVASMERRLAAETLPNDWNFQLLKDNQQMDDPEVVSVTPHDVATLLKRWIARVEGGIITQDVGHAINHLLSPDNASVASADKVEKTATPTDTPTTVNNPMFGTPRQPNPNDDDDYLKTPTDPKMLDYLDDDADNEIPTRAPSRVPYLYVKQLESLPIQNLHLLVYLLSVFSKLSEAQLAQKTRMDSINIAKMMQLSIFNTDDLVKEPKDNSGSMESFTELKTCYDNFEGVLTNWIDFYSHLVDQLAPILAAKENEMENILQSNNSSRRVIQKMKSQASIESVVSYNEEFGLHFPKEKPAAIKITTFISSPHEASSAACDADEGDSESIVYTPIDMKTQIPDTKVPTKENIVPENSLAKTTATENHAALPDVPQPVLRRNSLANKPKQGLGLKFKGLFKRKGADSSTETNTGNPERQPVSEIRVSKRDESKTDKKEKRKSSFQFLTRS